MTKSKTAPIATLLIAGLARLAKTWGGHDVRSEPEDGEEGGDAGELVPGRELRITELPIEQDHFERLVGAGAWNSFFNEEADRPAERAFASFSRLKLDDKFKNCAVEIVFGVQAKSVTIDSATIKNITLKFGKTSKPEMSCTIVGARPRSIEVLDLEEFGGKPITVTLAFGPVARDSEQQTLTLEQPAVSVGEPEKRKPGRPRKQSNAEHAISH
jgi:hypothetical protein